MQKTQQWSKSVVSVVRSVGLSLSGECAIKVDVAAVNVKVLPGSVP